MSALTDLTQTLLCKACRENIVTDRARDAAKDLGVEPVFCTKCLGHQVSPYRLARIREAVSHEKEVIVPTKPKGFSENDTTIYKVAALLGTSEDTVRKLLREGLLVGKGEKHNASDQEAVLKESVLELIEICSYHTHNSARIPEALRKKVEKNFIEICAKYHNGALDF